MSEAKPLLGRRVVFLQGPSSRFFIHAARACRSLGAEVLRIGFAPGDRLYWSASAGRYLAFRGRPEAFSAFFRAFLARERPTDILMLGDGRFYHAEALAVLAAQQAQPVTPPPVTPWIIEHGYLRPDLLLMETWGMGGNSRIPAAFRAHPAAQAGNPPATGPEPARLPSSFLRYGALDLGYHAANLIAGPVFYPYYRHHALDGPVREYAGWAGKALTLPWRRRAAAEAARQIATHRGPVFLFPLQLATDYQIRNYGTGASLAEILDGIIASFARAAPEDALLVVRQHPLDNGLSHWGRQVQAAAKQSGIASRVVFQDGGDAAPVMARAAGMITVNSTMGLSAILQGIPCHVLGRAVYALPGLVSQGAPDGFWTHPIRPGPALMASFAAFLRDHYHIRGSFDGPGALIGADNLARRLALSPPPVA